MCPYLDITTQQKLEPSIRLMADSYCSFQEAVSALAGERMLERRQKEPGSPRWKRLLCVPSRILVRIMRWLIYLVFLKRQGSDETRHWQVSDTEPNVIDVFPDALHHRRQWGAAHRPSLINRLQQYQTGEQPARRVTGHFNGER